MVKCNLLKGKNLVAQITRAFVAINYCLTVYLFNYGRVVLSCAMAVFCFSYLVPILQCPVPSNCLHEIGVAFVVTFAITRKFLLVSFFVCRAHGPVFFPHSGKRFRRLSSFPFWVCFLVRLTHLVRILFLPSGKIIAVGGLPFTQCGFVEFRFGRTLLSRSQAQTSFAPLACPSMQLTELGNRFNEFTSGTSLCQGSLVH